MEANQDLEVEYTPSLFSTRFKTSEEIFDNFNKFAKEGETFIICFYNQ